MQAHNTSQFEEDEILPPYIMTSQIQLPRDVKRAAHFLEPAQLSASHGPNNLSIWTYLVWRKYEIWVSNQILAKLGMHQTIVLITTVD